MKRSIFLRDNQGQGAALLRAHKSGQQSAWRRQITVALVSIYLFSITGQTHANLGQNTGSAASVPIGVQAIGSEYQNSIKILNNRFRIDSDIEEVTIVFFRAFGSAPIVLVRPDGSKLYLDNDIADDSYNWFETDTYDMISLKEPMPGPWQAVGEILPESRVMVIAGITLYAQAIPDIVFSGETIKQTARLQNIGSEVDISLFRDVVSLSIEFVSTNNPSFPNFGLGASQIARFEDDGLGFDEFPADGIFTGQFNLEISEGEWRPIFTVRTPLFSREQINENIILRPTPVKVSHQENANENGDHVVTIEVDSEFLNPNNFVVDGSVRYPNGEVMAFSMTQASDNPRTLSILNNDLGIYKVNMTVFATTQNGRDVILTVPEYSFVTSASQIEPIAVIEDETVMQEDVSAEAVTAIEDQGSSWLLMAITVNIMILILGSLLILCLVSKRNNPHDHLWLRGQRRAIALWAKSVKSVKAVKAAKKQGTPAQSKEAT